MIGFIIANKVYYHFAETNNLLTILLIAFLMGNIFFCFSLIITNWNHFKDIRLFTCNLGLFLPFLLDNIKRVPSIAYIVLEELFWRGYLQELSNSILMIPMITGLFTLVHFSKFKKERADFLSVLEFYLYFILVSIVFYTTHSIYASILIHLIRNIYAEYWGFLKKMNSRTATIKFQ